MVFNVLFLFSDFYFLFLYFIRVLAIKAYILSRMHAKDVIYNISSFSAAMSHAFSKCLITMLPYEIADENTFLVLKIKSKVPQ